MVHLWQGLDRSKLRKTAAKPAHSGHFFCPFCFSVFCGGIAFGARHELREKMYKHAILVVLACSAYLVLETSAQTFVAAPPPWWPRPSRCRSPTRSATSPTTSRAATATRRPATAAAACPAVTR
ncbi:hypothetical protein V5799_025729 [Amblyomma americanum]|uniref:Uncharacterized protein n=1 Tax=Amblyomma americanum TaxID=6943 RepID=A0AAQ4E8P3_AMBAM